MERVPLTPSVPKHLYRQGTLEKNLYQRWRGCMLTSSVPKHLYKQGTLEKNL